MAVGTSFNKLHGRLILSEPNIIFHWKGRIAARALPKKIDQIKSDDRSDINTLLARLSPRWQRDLTKADRDRWEIYANLLGSAIDADKQDLARGSHNVIRSRMPLMSGFNAYVMSNMLALSAGLPYPKDIAPLGDPKPSPPSGIGLSYAAGTATVTWTDPVLVTTPPIAEKKVRVFAQIQIGKKIHTQIVGLLDIPTPATLDFTTMRGGGAFGSPICSIGDMTAGLLRVQLDTVTAVTTVRGCLASPPSTVVEIPITI
jgi:hypothetical protein